MWIGAVKFFRRTLPSVWRLIDEAVGRLRGLSFLVIMLAVVGWLLVMTSQGQALLADDVNSWYSTIVLNISAAILGLESWFWSRFLIDRASDKIGTLRNHANFLLRPVVIWTPRMLGALPFIFIVAAILKSGSMLEFFRPVAIGSGIVGLVLTVALYFRIPVITWLGRSDPVAAANLMRTIANLFVWVGMGVAAFGVVAFSLDRVSLPHALGSLSVVYIGVALIISLIEGLLFLSRESRLPVLGTVLVWTCFISFFREGHDVGARVGGLPAGIPAGKPPPPTLSDAFNAWQLDNPQNGADDVPIIFISIEGGASRSGYWAARVLGQLQADNPDFSRRIFSISSVSGGSIGVVAFLSALHEASCSTSEQEILRRMTGVAGEDFLSPAVGALLFPDLLQRFWPGILPDRAQALEEAFEAGWKAHCNTPCDADLWKKPFLTLWDKNRASRPVLVINGTRVEDGARVLTSNIAITPDVFPDAADFHIITRRDPAISTAILNGARFPLVSPGGAMWNGSIEQGHIVDGGYFDDSGEVTTLDIARKVEALRGNEALRGSMNLRPIFIQITNNPRAGFRTTAGAISPSVEARKVAVLEQKETHLFTFLPDLLGPLLGMFDARQGHDTTGRAALSHAFMPVHLDSAEAVPILEAQGWSSRKTLPVVINFNLGTLNGREVPMDWVLDAKTRREIDGIFRSTGDKIDVGTIKCPIWSVPTAAKLPSAGTPEPP